MAKIIGQDVEIAITKESTRGTTETAISGDWLQRGSIEISSVKEMAEVMVNEGRITTRRELKAVHFENEITITMPAERKHFGKFLAGFYGTVSTSTDDPEVGVNTHTYSILDTGYVPTYTISEIAGTKQNVYALGLISNLQLSFTTENVPEVSVTFLTKKVASTSGLTASYPTTSWFSPVDFALYSTLTYAGIGSGNSIDTIEANIEWTRDPLKMKYLGSDTQSNAIVGDFDVKASITKHFDEETWASGDTDYAEDDYIDNSTRALRIELTDTSTTLGAATNPKITVDIPSSKLAEYNRTPELKEIVGETFDFMPFDDGTNDMSLSTLINDVTGY